MHTRTSRAASHAGSWYTSDGKTLNSELDGFLAKVVDTVVPYPVAGCKAIIAPHAGYSYSGPATAWAYKAIDTTDIKRVFILGPSHHVYLEGCALSKCKQYETPIGNLPLDLDTINELKATKQFELFSLQADEDEHSLEMHLPYVRKIFEGKDISIVPIVVGNISKETEAQYGALLAPYLARDDTLFVISSDFCHWGTRFSYTYYYPDATEAPGIRLGRGTGPSQDYPIYQSITKLDHEAIDVLTVPPSTAADSHTQFADYLARTKNTICGRHPIGVLFGALAALENGDNVKPEVKWVRYEQSSQCYSVRDSSVSYASAFVTF
ncbi:hypothetical protein D9619_003218 [Psilocybe cf. subviscida]|uniref:Uncharacterized protein n=1 Tax=Psilocybe cf. subviscida TaxID=2480587 RepID=A0A8H5AY24_9AGAR|nr:hypothetical protein D9619_003218 [Psilocybe cf. subviscida]